MWIEITTDHRIRDEFFPGVEIRHSLEYAIIVDERVEHRRTLATLGEEEEGPTPHLARFHEITPGHAVIVAQFSTDQGPEYRLGELPGHTESLAEEMTWAPIPFARPMSGTFLTNTVRGGSNPSTTLRTRVARQGESRARLDLLAACLGTPNDTDLSGPAASAIR